jgi:hypothetical protein
MVDGWLVADCVASDFAEVYMQLGKDADWTPAFRDYDESGNRVAKIRPGTATGVLPVVLRVGSDQTPLGNIRL